MHNNKRTIRQSFNKAASTYAQSAQWQKCAAHALIQRAKPLLHRYQKILDLGMGPIELLSTKILPDSSLVIGIDFAEKMLEKAQGSLTNAYQFICADAENIPLYSNSIDLVISNIVLHWCSLPKALSEIYRILRLDGHLLFSVLSADSLSPFVKDWKKIDPAYEPNPFPSEKYLLALLKKTGFTHVTSTKITYWQHYATLKKLLQEFKNTGTQTRLTPPNTTLNTDLGFTQRALLHKSYNTPCPYHVLFIQGKKGIK